MDIFSVHSHAFFVFFSLVLFTIFGVNHFFKLIDLYVHFKTANLKYLSYRTDYFYYEFNAQNKSTYF